MHALDVIEFPAILALLAERCETALGAELALQVVPEWSADGVSHRVRLTSEADALVASGLPSLKAVRDVRESVSIAGKGGTLEGEILALVAKSLNGLRLCAQSILDRQELAPSLSHLAQQLPQLDRLESNLNLVLDGDGFVKDSASPELAAIRSKKAKTAQRVMSTIQSYVSGKTRDLLSDPIYTERSGRFVIPLKAENRGKIKGIVHDTSASGHTIYLEPEDVVQLGNQLREAEAEERAEIVRILRALSEQVGKHAPEIVGGIEAASHLDLVFAKVRLGRDMGGIVPDSAQGPVIKIRSGRHPLLNPEIAVPLSLELGEELDVLLITGPNTGGKTISIKTVGLFVAMGQSGMMVPAQHVELGCFSQIWADIGDEQSLQQSLSTFSGHIKNISTALGRLKAGCLVLLDEVGAGTDPAEGAALARAILLQFQKQGAKVMASTHHGELKVFASDQPGFLNASMEFDLKSLAPTYRLMVGTPGSSHAFRIAERYGIPPEVIGEAEAGIGIQEQSISRMIENLETAQKRAQRAQSEADRLTNKVREVEREAAQKMEEAERVRVSVRERASRELDEVLRAIRLEATDIFEELKRDSSQAGLDKARKRLKDLQEVGSDFSKDMKPVVFEAPKPDAKVVKGSQVKIAGMSLAGVVLEEPKGKSVLVQVGSMKMSVALNQLELVKSAVPKATKPQVSNAGRTQTASREIQLIQMRAESAQESLDSFLDDAVLAGLHEVRIVHGKGEGILRKLTRETLKRHRHVVEFRDGEAGEGGHGVTIASLE